MKVNKICLLCDELWNVKKGSNRILCPKCRGKNSNSTNHRNLKKKLVSDINKNYKFMKINNTCGKFNLSINIKNLELGNSTKKILDKKSHREYLKSIIENLKEDLLELNKIGDKNDI